MTLSTHRGMVESVSFDNQVFLSSRLFDGQLKNKVVGRFGWRMNELALLKFDKK